MFRDDLYLAADRLLASIQRDPRAPHYRDETFRRKVTRSNRRDRRLPLPRSKSGAGYLADREWLDVIERARLTPPQLHVLALRAEGYSFEQIGGRRGHSKQAARHIFVQAARKLARSWAEYPFRGLRQAFEDDVRRGVFPSRRR